MYTVILKGVHEPTLDIRLTIGNTPGDSDTAERFFGIDVGAETLKLVELTRSAGHWHWTRRRLLEHHMAPGPLLIETLRACNWP